MNFFRSSFLQSFIKILSANVVAQLLPFIFIPLLTRLYTPEQFGIVAILASVSSLLAVIASGKFELALIICDTQDERDNVQDLCFRMLLIFVSALVVVLAILYQWNLLSSLGLSFDSVYFFIPLIVLVTGANNIFFNMANSQRRINAISIATIVQAASNNLSSLVLYLVSGLGLVIGYVMAQLLSAVILFKFQNTDRLVFRQLKWADYKGLVKKYKKFPVYTVPSDALDTYTKQIPIYFLSALQSAASAGIFSLTDRVLNKPLTLIGRAVSVHFRSEAARDYKEEGSCRKILIKTLMLLIAISIFPFTILYIFAPELFSWVFGAKWRVAGEYAQILVPTFFMQFISSPLSYILIIARKQEVDFYIHILMFFALSGCFLVGLYHYESIELALQLYSAVYTLVYAVYLFLYVRYAVNHSFAPMSDD